MIASFEITPLKLAKYWRRQNWQQTGSKLAENWQGKSREHRRAAAPRQSPDAIGTMAGLSFPVGSARAFVWRSKP
jgi:hypothetical protein